MRKIHCCLQGDCSGLEMGEPSQHFGFEKVSFLFLLTPSLQLTCSKSQQLGLSSSESYEESSGSTGAWMGETSAK